MSTLIAYHGEQSIKDKYLDRVRQHRAADELIRGTGWDESRNRGCAVGCTLHSYDHLAFETELGIPVRLARLEDVIFENLPIEIAMEWPERFLSAIKPGVDLSNVWHRFEHWKLTESGLLTINDLNRDAIRAVAELHHRSFSVGTRPTTTEWSAARSAAESAAESAWSARSAARSAAESAWSARSARSAARSAAESAAESAWSAESAAESAESAAWSAESAAWIKMANKLIELLGAAQ